MEVSLATLAGMVGGRLEGPPDRLVSGIKGLEEAGESDVAFLGNPRYAKVLPDCRAGVVLVKPDQKVPEGMAVIRVDNPYLAYAKILTAAYSVPYKARGVDPKAAVDDTAVLADDVSVYPNAYVGPDAELGPRVVLYPGVYVGAGAKVGEGSVLHPNVVLHDRCLVGKRCIIHGGTVIGADGYSFVPDEGRHFKIPQVGIVQIDDDVEIGANCTIDRAATGITWIKRGAKFDNMVHVGHNCVVGENTLLVAQVAIAGSAKVGNNVTVGGQVGINGHIEVGDGAMIGPQAGIAKSVKPGDVVSGTTAMPHRLWLKTRKLVERLPELYDRVKALEAKDRTGD